MISYFVREFRTFRNHVASDIFTHCTLTFYLLGFFKNTCPLVWIFFKNSYRKTRNTQKSNQHALAPTVFIVLSIVLKLDSPSLNTQAQNMLLVILSFALEVKVCGVSKAVFYHTLSELKMQNVCRRSKLRKSVPR